MGFAAQVQQSQTGGGKGSGASQIAPAQNPNPDMGQPTNSGNPQASSGKGGSSTNSSTSGQPRIGMPNQYSNTVGQWDNTQIQPVKQQGKGKAG